MRVRARIGGLIAVAIVVLAAALSGAAGAHGRAHASAATPDWLAEINRYRAAAQLAPVTDNPAWDLGIRHHLTYLEKTPASERIGAYASAHTENPQSPYYTADGAQEGGSSDLYPGGVHTDLAAIDGWFEAPFHAIGMLRAQLTQVAFANDPGPGYAGLDILSGLDQNAPAASGPILFPGPGITTNLTSFGGESPNPLETCGWVGRSVGLPLIALLPQAPAQSLTASLRGPGGTESSAAGSLCVVDSSTYRSSDPIYGQTGGAILQGDNAVLLIPREPLANGTYTTTISQPGQPDIAWSFSVKASSSSPGGTCNVTCQSLRRGGALSVPRRTAAGRPLEMTLALAHTFVTQITVRSARGKVLVRFTRKFSAGLWQFALTLPHGQARKGRVVSLTVRLTSGRRHLVLRASTRYG